MRRSFHSPEIGLQSGSILFDPSSLILFAERYEESVGFLEKLPSAGGFSSQEGTRSAILAHEQDHLLRMLSTSYGFLSYNLDVAMTLFFVETAHIAIRAGCVSLFPLCQSYGEGLAAFPLPYLYPRDEILRLRNSHHYRNLCHLLAFEELQRALNGTRPLFDEGMALFGFRLMDSFVRGYSVLPQTLTLPPRSAFLQSFYDPQHPAVPIVRGQPFGAFWLMECLGYLMEVQISRVHGGSGEILEEKLGAERYRGVYQLFQDFVLPHQRQDQRESDMLMIAFEAAVELSLWVPWGTAGSLYPMEWTDMQPGWRFLTLLEHLAHKRVELEAPALDDFADIDRAVNIIQERLCQLAGWPSPAEIIDEWLAVDDNTTTFPLLYRDHPRRRFLRMMLAWRRDSPFRLYLNDERVFVQEQSPSFPGLVCEDLDVTFDTKVWQDLEGNALNWVDYYTFKGFRFFHHGAERHLDILGRHLPRMVRTLESVAVASGEDDPRFSQALRSYVLKEEPDVDWETM